MRHYSLTIIFFNGAYSLCLNHATRAFATSCVNYVNRTCFALIGSVSSRTIVSVYILRGAFEPVIHIYILYFTVQLSPPLAHGMICSELRNYIEGENIC